MTDRNAATSVRLVAPRAAVSGVPGDDLASINTAKLPNGALVMVNSSRALYQLDKTSTASPDNQFVVAPGAGPGRWLFVVATNAPSLFQLDFTTTVGVLGANTVANQTFISSFDVLQPTDKVLNCTPPNNAGGFVNPPGLNVWAVIEELAGPQIAVTIYLQNVSGVAIPTDATYSVLFARGVPTG